MEIIIPYLILLLMIIVLSQEKNYRAIIFFGILARVFIYYADLFHWFYILGSGADTEQFNFYARMNVEHGMHFNLTHYTDFLTFIYSLTNCSRPFAQFINLCFGTGVILFCAKTVDLFNIPAKYKKRAVMIVAFMPNLIIYSGILLREAWIDFFVMLSVYEFTKWYLRDSKLSMVLCIAFACGGVYMHDGVAGIIVGYLAAFALYNPKTRKVSFTVSKAIMMVVLIGGLAFFSGDVLGEKSAEFTNNSSEDLIVKYASHEGTGNSAYLAWLPETNNPAVGLLLAPLKIFYFLFSPIPTDWHRAVDVIAFFIDSIVYVIMIWAIWRRMAPQHMRAYKQILLTAVSIGVFLFAYGTFNAGTAMRHRAKFCAPIAVLCAISMSKTKKTKYIKI